MNNELKKDLIKGFLFVFSVFLLALCYNLFFVPNNLVVGGISGLSIVVQKVFNINATYFIYGATVVLVIASHLFLGKERTSNTLIGSILYPIMITISAPIAAYLIPYFKFDDIYLIAFISAVIFGFANGLVFRFGFSTGGTDIITSIFTKIFKLPEGKSMWITNVVIILFGGYVFGLYLMLINLIILYVSTIVLDRVMFDLSNSKVFYVFTRKEEEIRDLILKEFHTGFTIMPTKGGYSHQDGIIIMTVLPNRAYYHFKSRVLEVDKKAFFIICDCYESQGGYKKRNIPFMEET